MTSPTEDDGNRGRSLRERAESQIRALESDELPRSAAEAGTLLHELRVHQFELEMQNEELRRAQLALDIARARYFDLYDLAPVGYVTVGEGGEIVEANLRACGLLQTERAALLSMPLSRFIVAADQDTYYLHRRQVRTSGEAKACELRMKRREGTEFWARLESVAAQDEGSGAATVRTTLSDVSEIRGLRDNAALTDRMASIGALAASLAHEINNPLTYVQYFITSLAEDLPVLADAVKWCREALIERVDERTFVDLVGENVGMLDASSLADLTDRATKAATGARHIAAISRELSFFARVDPTELSLVDVNEAAKHAINLAANEVRSRALMVMDLQPVPKILASTGRLAQALLNLLTNAAHAITEGAVADNSVTLRTWAEASGHVCLSVVDTGCGIPPEHHQRIFEPFFTTKGPDRGTGLGLPITGRIVAGFGGDIRFESVVGTGTRFELRFPVGCVEAEPPPAVDRTEVPDLHGRVLLVDDEELVRMAIVRMLRDRHDVVDVESARAAMQLLDAGLEFDVILCDLVMPRISGTEFHAWLAEHHPLQRHKLVFLTAGVFTPQTQHYLASVPNPCLEKPLEVGAFRQIVAKMVWAARGALP